MCIKWEGVTTVSMYLITISVGFGFGDITKPFFSNFSCFIMYALVRYIEDDIFYVCPINNIYSRKNNEAMVKYSNGHKYVAEILCTHGEYHNLFHWLYRVARN